MMNGAARKLILFIFSMIIMLTGSSVSESSTGLWTEGPDLAKMLNNRIFSSFTTDTSYLAVEYLSMCEGDLLLYCRVSDEFGWRIHPRSRRTQFHTGIDLAAPKGSPIISPVSGRIKRVAYGRGYGRFVELEHGYTWGTKYAHLKKVYVKQGQYVRKGDVIGEVGSSGTSTGPHLHFEILYFGKAVNPRDHFASLKEINYPAITFANR